MNTVRYIKSFSKGQITIPKEVRKVIGVSEDFWLKLYVQNGKLIAEPVQTNKKTSGYFRKLISVKGDWLSQSENQKIRAEIEARLKKNDL